MNKSVRMKQKNKFTAMMLIFAMLCSVICVFPSYAVGDEGQTRSLVSGTNFADGVYVFNNRLTGKYLGRNATGTSFTMHSGKISTIGSSIQFSMNYIAGGCYVMRLNGVYLTRSTSLSDKNVALSVSHNNNYSLWSIETNTFNGYTYHYFKNAQTDEYLTWQNGTLQVVSTIGYEGTEAFYACSWRVANPESGVFVELSSVTIDNMWLPYGAEEKPVIHANPSIADMCAPFDFTYTCDTAYVGVDALEGYIMSNNYGATYTKTITATHKPTGVQTTFSVTINPQGALVGVTATDGRDRISGLNAASQSLISSGYGSCILATGSFSEDTIEGYLDSNTNSIFVSRSHGYWTTNSSGTLDGTYIVIDEVNSIRYKSKNIPEELDLSNIRIAVFGGCYTGLGGAVGKNLPNELVSRGARVAIGFKVTIDCGMANEWTELFFEELANGSTVDEAVETINNMTYPNQIDGRYLKYSVMEPYIAGDGTVTLN